MKLFPYILLLLLLQSCNNEKADHRTSSTNNQEISTEKKTESIIGPYSKPNVIVSTTDTLRATRSGVIDWINKSSKIKKGQVIYGFNNTSFFDELNDKKTRLKADLETRIDESSVELSTIKPKWKSFANSLRSDTLLPKFPEIQYKEEGEYYGREEFIIAYNEIYNLERKMNIFFIKSKTTYKNIHWKVKKGQKIKAGQIIAIAEQN